MIDFGPIWEAAGPVLATFLLAVGSALGTIACGYLYRRWGIQIDQDARATLHSAFETGTRKVVAELGKSIQDKNVNIGSPQIAKIIDIAFKHAPGAMKHFGIEKMGEAATNLAVSKLQKVLEGPVPPNTEAVEATRLSKSGLL